MCAQCRTKRPTRPTKPTKAPKTPKAPKTRSLRDVLGLDSIWGDIRVVIAALIIDVLPIVWMRKASGQ